MSEFVAEEYGTRYTADYRIYFKGPNGYVSPFHDIPLWADKANGIVNMVCEVPRWTNAKMEISKKEELNPICQDIKKGKPRFVHNCFPHHGYIWNYGAIPQTWENPSHTDEHTGCKGDNDPIDICEIGEKVATPGEIKQVKVLGVMAMIDEGETDWKVLGIDINDPLASQINDIDDIDKFMPGQLAATNEWFRIYKMPDGKPENTFAFNGEAKSKDFALQIIKDTNEQWQSLISNQAPEGLRTKCTVAESTNKISAEEAAAIVSAAPAHQPDAALDSSVHKWHYIKLWTDKWTLHSKNSSFSDKYTQKYPSKRKIQSKL